MVLLPSVGSAVGVSIFNNFATGDSSWKALIFRLPKGVLQEAFEFTTILQLVLPNKRCRYFCFREG